MDEYIKREDAIKETRKPRTTDAEMRRRIALIPAEDVRKNAYCEDCAFFEKQKSAEIGICGLLGIPMKKKDFCSYWAIRAKSE